MASASTPQTRVLPYQDPYFIHGTRIRTSAAPCDGRWDARTPHGNFPNQSAAWRVCQYIGFHPAPTAAQADVARCRREDMELLADSGHTPGGRTPPKRSPHCESLLTVGERFLTVARMIRFASTCMSWCHASHSCAVVGLVLVLG